MILVYIRSTHHLDPNDLSPYIGPEDADTLRCKIGGVCEGWHLTCAQAEDRLQSDEGSVEDCALAKITDPRIRADAVKAAVAEAWQAYRSCAWGADNINPLSCGSSQWFGLSLTLVDSLSTLELMGMHAEFEEGARWVAANMTLDNGRAVSVFETTIRVIGGLLSAYSLAQTRADPALLQPLLEAAAEMGGRLLPAFAQSPSGIPFAFVNLTSGQAGNPIYAPKCGLAEAGTLSLEWTLLSRLTGDPVFEAAALNVHSLLTTEVLAHRGLLPIDIHPTSMLMSGSVTMGARGDSYYEYLLKQWILTGKSDDVMLQRYTEAMQSVRTRLISQTPGGLWYVSRFSDPPPEVNDKPTVGHRRPQRVQPVPEQVKASDMEHLACFLPGLIALGHLHGVDTRVSGAESPDEPQGMSDLRLARELTRTCYEGYRMVPTGIAPDAWTWTEKGAGPRSKTLQREFSVASQNVYSLLRPETAESIYLMWKVTGDPQYRDWAWTLFRAFQRWGRVRPGLRLANGTACASTEEGCTLRGAGYASLSNVMEVPPAQKNIMESFFVAETLKYLWLVHADAPDACAVPNCVRASWRAPRLLPLDAWVFNTEAHPLPLAGPMNASYTRPSQVPPELLHPFRLAADNLTAGT